MASLWDDIAKTIREGLDTVVEKTEELTKIGRIRVDIINIKRNVEKNFAELGGRVYHLFVEEKKTEVAGDKEVKEIIECVKILEKELADKKRELEQVRKKDKNGSKPAPAPAAKPEAKADSSAEARPKAKPKSRSTSAKKTAAKKPKAPAAE